jgi:hypothetical protein
MCEMRKFRESLVEASGTGRIPPQFLARAELFSVYLVSRAMARQPMSRRQNPPGHLILSTAA